MDALQPLAMLTKLVTMCSPDGTQEPRGMSYYCYTIIQDVRSGADNVLRNTRKWNQARLRKHVNTQNKHETKQRNLGNMGYFLNKPRR